MDAVQVMIVEDQAMLAAGLRRRLNRLGYIISDLAATGEEAVIKALDGEHDVILMDIRLRGQIDGVEAAKRIREQCTIPIVFATAYADEETVSRAATIQPDGYVLKPYDDAALKRAIEIAVARPTVRGQVNQPYTAAAPREPAPSTVPPELIHKLNNELAFVRCSIESLGLEGPLTPAQDGLVRTAMEHLANVIAGVSTLQQSVASGLPTMLATGAAVH